MTLLEPSALKPGKGAFAGRHCPVCTAGLKIRDAVDEMVNRGDPVAAVYRWALQKFPTELTGVKYDSFTRHVRLHTNVVKRATRKLSDADRMQRQRVDTAKAVLADKIDPQAYFSPAQLAQDIKRTSDRLEVAADRTAETGQFASLAALSNGLLKSHELRAKLGGSIADKTEISINVALTDLHSRLDGILGAPPAERQSAARSLLGLAPSPLQSTAMPMPVEPSAVGITIDAEPVADS